MCTGNLFLELMENRGKGGQQTIQFYRSTRSQREHPQNAKMRGHWGEGHVFLLILKQYIIRTDLGRSNCIHHWLQQMSFMHLLGNHSQYRLLHLNRKIQTTVKYIYLNQSLQNSAPFQTLKKCPTRTEPSYCVFIRREARYIFFPYPVSPTIVHPKRNKYQTIFERIFILRNKNACHVLLNASEQFQMVCGITCNFQIMKLSELQLAG